MARLMKNYGGRVQKSVFECDINDNLYVEMKRKIEKSSILNVIRFDIIFFVKNVAKGLKFPAKGCILR